MFTRPDGTRVETNGTAWRFRGNNSRQPNADALFELNLSKGIEIDEQTARCQWLGERMDYGLAIEHLILVRDRRRAGAEILQQRIG